jgi:hypothetical protein
MYSDVVPAAEALIAGRDSDTAWLYRHLMEACPGTAEYAVRAVAVARRARRPSRDLLTPLLSGATWGSNLAATVEWLAANPYLSPDDRSYVVERLQSYSLPGHLERNQPSNLVKRVLLRSGNASLEDAWLVSDVERVAGRSKGHARRILRGPAAVVDAGLPSGTTRAATLYKDHLRAKADPLQRDVCKRLAEDDPRDRAGLIAALHPHVSPALARRILQTSWNAEELALWIANRYGRPEIMAMGSTRDWLLNECDDPIGPFALLAYPARRDFERAVRQLLRHELTTPHYARLAASLSKDLPLLPPSLLSVVRLGTTADLAWLDDGLWLRLLEHPDQDVRLWARSSVRKRPAPIRIAPPDAEQAIARRSKAAAQLRKRLAADGFIYRLRCGPERPGPAPPWRTWIREVPADGPAYRTDAPDAAACIEAIEFWDGTLEAVMECWIWHPDEIVPLALLLEATTLYQAKAPDSWLLLAERAVAQARSEGVLWTPLLNMLYRLKARYGLRVDWAANRHRLGLRHPHRWRARSRGLARWYAAHGQAAHAPDVCRLDPALVACEQRDLRGALLGFLLRNRRWFTWRSLAKNPTLDSAAQARLERTMLLHGYAVYVGLDGHEYEGRLPCVLDVLERLASAGRPLLPESIAFLAREVVASGCLKSARILRACINVDENVDEKTIRRMRKAMAARWGRW